MGSIPFLCDVCIETGILSLVAMCWNLPNTSSQPVTPECKLKTQRDWANSDVFIPSFHWHVHNAMILSVLWYVLFPSTLLHQLFFHPPSLHLAICLLVYLSMLFFPNSYIILFWESYFLPFSVHAQTNVICLTLPSVIVCFLTIA